MVPSSRYAGGAVPGGPVGAPYRTAAIGPTRRRRTIRALLITAGSRGDVEPFTALARALGAAGHSARVVIPDGSGADTAGLDTGSLGVDFGALVQAQGVSPLAAMRSLRERVRPAMRTILETAVREALAFRPDVIVSHPKILTAPHAADALGIPHVLIEPVPSMTPTRAFPAPGVVNVGLGPFNRLTYGAVHAANAMFRSEIADAAALLPATSRAASPSPYTASIVAVSPQLLTRPDDWPANVHLTGPLRDTNPPAVVDARVAEFIAGGEFVYAGFGSMVAGDPVARTVAVVRAARRNGLRVLIGTGWGGLQAVPSLDGDDVLVVASVPHDAVLPLATVAIHHGGAGTVHAVARAGIPSIVVPFIADQPFWGRTLHARGLAPRAIPYRRVDERRTHEAIVAAAECRSAATSVAAAMRDEDGTGAAVALLESVGSVAVG